MGFVFAPIVTVTALTTWATAAGRLLAFGFAGVYAGDEIPPTATGNWNFRLQHFFHILQFTHLIRCNKGNGPTITACTRSPADPVYVIFRHIWQVIVVNKAYVWNVQTTGGHIGGHQNFDFAGAQGINRALALTL